jgi:hypothetical protein
MEARGFQYLLACVRTHTRMCACGVSVVCVVLCVSVVVPSQKKEKLLTIFWLHAIITAIFSIFFVPLNCC